MSWAGDPMILHEKSEICYLVVVCLGREASYGNQSLGSPPQIEQAISCQSQGSTLVHKTMQGRGGGHQGT